MNDVDRDRLVNRLGLCRKEIHRAKENMIFWSNELRVVAQAICSDKQFDFDFSQTLKEEI